MESAMQVSQAEFARACGVSRQAVTKWKQDHGFLVFVGSKIDVAASRDLLARYRRAGVPDALRRYLAGDRSQPTERGRKLTLPRGEWMQRLQALDWTHTPAWTDDAQHQRVLAAAALVGLVAELDDAPDGISRHGGYQLRVWAGHGFELDAHEALAECRLAIAYPDDGPEELAEAMTMDPASLALLAYPFNPGHQRPNT
jgi:transcriptional regulator with XRE-family HTH domain